MLTVILIRESASGTFPRDLENTKGIRKLEVRALGPYRLLGPYGLLYCWDQPEYLEDFWKPEDTCYHSDSSERPPVKTAVKHSQVVIYT